MRVDINKKMTQAESDEMSALFGEHEPYFCCLFLDRKSSFKDNHETDILQRLQLDLLWKHANVFPHQINACFSQNSLNGPAVKDHTAAWRQTKRDLNITAATLSMGLHLIKKFDHADPDSDRFLDFPFHGNLDDAIAFIFAQTKNTGVESCAVSISYGDRNLFTIGILDTYTSRLEAQRREETDANIARFHDVDLETLRTLYYEAQYNRRDLPPSRNLHRHFGDDPRRLPNDGFFEKNSLLNTLIDSGDLFWATEVQAQDEHGRPVVWRQDPTFTDQGVQRWALPLWGMLTHHLIELGHLPAWKDHDLNRDNFFLDLGLSLDDAFLLPYQLQAAS